MVFSPKPPPPVWRLSCNRAGGIPPSSSSDMQNTVEYTGANKRVSPATVELLIRERSKGKSLRQLGQMFDRSHEGIRQLLAEYGPPLVTLLPEATVASKAGEFGKKHLPLLPLLSSI